MKKVLSLLGLSLLTAASASAYSFVELNQENVPVYYDINPDGCSVSVTYKEFRAVSYSGDVFLPDTVTHDGTEYTVTTIGTCAFLGCTDLTSVSLPEPATEIGQLAFSGCSGLATLAVHDSLRTIGLSAFEGCSKLDAINLPASLVSLGHNAFKDCTSLFSIAIPNGVNSIPGNCFNGCTSLLSVDVPESVTEIGSSAFQDCSSLSAIALPTTITEIGLYAFNGTGIYDNQNNWVDGVFYVGQYLIAAGQSVPDVCTVKDGTLAIANRAFADSKITTVNFPRQLKAIGEYAFTGCTGLTAIELPGNLVSVSVGAFKGCTALASISISDTVNSIGSGVFTGTAYYDNADNWEDDVLYIDNHLIKAKTTVGGDFVVPENIISIAGYAFSRCTDLTTVELPGSLRGIGPGAFEGCTSLVSAPLPEFIRTVGQQAFKDCSSLRDVVFPCYITSIGSEAYRGCTSLHYLTIETGDVGMGLSKIPSYAFYGCSSLTTLDIPSCVTSVGECAFADCDALTTLSLAYSVNNLGRWAFNGCSALEAIYLQNEEPANIFMGDEVFNYVDHATCVLYVQGDSRQLYAAAPQWKEFVNIVDEETPVEESVFEAKNESGVAICYAVNVDEANSVSVTYKSDDPTFYADEVVIPETVTYDNVTYQVNAIAAEAFKGCRSLRSVSIPATVSEIGAFAFQDCSELTSVVLPKGISAVATSLFDNCEALTSVTIPESVTEIRNTAFYGCRSLAEITIPETVNSIGQDVFTGTAIYEDTNNWEDGVLYIDKYLIKSLTKLDVPESDPGTESVSPKMSSEPIADAYQVKDGTIAIASGAFRGDEMLTNIELPKTLRNIGPNAFRDCVRLTSVDLPESVTSVGASAFKECSALSSVYISEGISFIGEKSFQNCSSLKTFKINIFRPQNITLGDDLFKDDDLSSATLYVPKGSETYYEAAEPWNLFGFVEGVDFSGIEDVVASPVLPADNVYYDMQGRRVARPTSGLYILNGRKVFVK